MHTTIKNALLHESFAAKKKKREREKLGNCSLMPILDHIEGENKRMFDNTEKEDHTIKQSFIYNFLE